MGKLPIQLLPEQIKVDGSLSTGCGSSSDPIVLSYECLKTGIARLPFPAVHAPDHGPIDLPLQETAEFFKAAEGDVIPFGPKGFLDLGVYDCITELSSGLLACVLMIPVDEVLGIIPFLSDGGNGALGSIESDRLLFRLENDALCLHAAW